MGVPVGCSQGALCSLLAYNRRGSVVYRFDCFRSPLMFWAVFVAVFGISGNGHAGCSRFFAVQFFSSRTVIEFRGQDIGDRGPDNVWDRLR